jgi:nicotinamidase/pyrazinamidase
MKALIVVDAQYDFMPGGNLAVPEGDKIIPVVNDLIPKFDLIIFTKDWHPKDHKSFASQHEAKNVFEEIELNGLTQVLWPDHCVQDTLGSEIHKEIDFSKISGDFYFFKKGMDKGVDSYSAFYDNGRKNSTGLSKFLNEKNVSKVFITGLALDFCVAFTAIDSAFEGFETIVIKDATKAINETNTERVFKEFDEANVKIIESWELPLFNLM